MYVRHAGNAARSPLLVRREKFPSAGTIGSGHKNLPPPAEGLPCFVVCHVGDAMGAANPFHPKHAAKNLGFTFVGNSR
jgi:hypothetical protein